MQQFGIQVMSQVVAMVAQLRGERGQKGQGMVEYALILVGIAVVALVGIKVLGPQISTLFNTITTDLTAAG